VPGMFLCRLVIIMDPVLAKTCDLAGGEEIKVICTLLSLCSVVYIFCHIIDGQRCQANEEIMYEVEVEREVQIDHNLFCS